MEVILNNMEVRVLGCLIEKELATPEYYPLTLNALTNACNQKSNRDPMTDYSERTVMDAMLLVRQRGLARMNSSGRTDKHRHIVAVIGDGAMTGGIAYEALNNLGHSRRPVIIVLNDNGRSYAPTVSNLSANSQARDPREDHPTLNRRIGERLASALTDIRLNPVYVRRQRRLEEFLHNLPVVGTPAERAVDALKAGVREFLQPPSFFEALGVRYVGPVDGHNIVELEQAFRNAIELSAEGPIVVHVLTQKGRGYPPAEDDDEKHLHDAPVFDPLTGPPKAVPTGYTQAFAEAIIKEAELDPRLVAITAAMPGPTGLLPFQQHCPERFFDVGIAEQHAVTGAAGMAMGGLRPVVAIYSTFLSRAWDQVVYDVALHRLPVVFCLDRAGITGDDGPSHHGVYDMALLSKVPGMRVLAPSSVEELHQMLHDAMRLADSGPVAIRYPKGTARHVGEHEVGSGINARVVREGDGSVCILAIGKLVGNALKAAELLAATGVDATVWDVRCCAPLDPDMIADAARHEVVVTVEDGVREGGIGMTIADQVGVPAPSVPVLVLGLPTRFVPQGKPDHILAQLGLDAAGIAASVRSMR
jgi:1-deoxy-D-xylulose-5-phosphate synthase